MTDNKEIMIYPNRLKLLLLLAGSLLFVLLCIRILYAYNMQIIHIDSFYAAVSVAGIIFFGIGFVIFLRKLIDNKPIYIISDEGIYYYQFPKSKMLYWKYAGEISEVSVPMANQKVIYIKIKEGFEKESNVTQNYFDGGYRVEVNANIVKGYNHDNLMKLIKEYFSRNKNG